MSEQAFFKGFVKRAMDNGLSSIEAELIYKKANIGLGSVAPQVAGGLGQGGGRMGSPMQQPKSMGPTPQPQIPQNPMQIGLGSVAPQVAGGLGQGGGRMGSPMQQPYFQQPPGGVQRYLRGEEQGSPGDDGGFMSPSFMQKHPYFM